jgi:hypothetical protein
LTISRSWMAMKPCIIQNQIEWAFIWEFFIFAAQTIYKKYPIKPLLTTFLCIDFFREAISTISMARMVIKVYIIRKTIELSLMWLLFPFDNFNRSWDIRDQKAG